MISSLKFHFFLHFLIFFVYLETPPIYLLLAYPSKQFCRNYIFSAREPTVCSTNYFFIRRQIIQKTVSKTNHVGPESLFLNFIGEFDHLPCHYYVFISIF